MLTFNLRSVLAMRDIQQPYTYLVSSGFSRHTAHNLLNGYSASFRLRHIDKLCVLLHCTPNDLFIWSPNPRETLLPGHPFTTLKRRASNHALKETMRTASLDELEHIASVILKMKETKGE